MYVPLLRICSILLSYSQALIHNAAAPNMAPFKLTVDGFETQMATDHIGPFLLTKLIAPKLLATRTTSFTPRVVFVSSMAHAYGAVDLSIVAHPDPTQYILNGLPTAYCQAKSANILTAIEMTKRARGKINAYSLHPGCALTTMALHPP
jgi:NAD(P)-dependent dehydrogenase (short-subunit alcohol dehydrogenase family)